MQQIEDEPPGTWEPEIAGYEREDRRSPPPAGAVVFVGSSSIRMWSTLACDMAPLVVLNRGFGGAQMDAVLHFAPRIVLRYRPRAVVLCAGENDLEAHRGKSPERVLDDVRRFADLLADACPHARLYLLAIKPSPARAAVWPVVRRCNGMLRAFALEDPRRSWIDVATPTFDEAGRRRAELFLDDGLHLSPAGYAMWTSVLRPRLVADLAAR